MPRRKTEKKKLNKPASIMLNDTTFDGKLIESGISYAGDENWTYYWIFVSDEPIPFERDNDLELQATSFAHYVSNYDTTGRMYNKSAVVKKIVARKRVLITQMGGWDV